MSIKQEGPLKPFVVQFTTQVRASSKDSAELHAENVARIIREGGYEVEPDNVTVYPFVRHTPLRHTITRHVDVYQGFAKAQAADRSQWQRYTLTAVWLVDLDQHPDEGPADLWLVDGLEGEEELRRYYKAEYGNTPIHMERLVSTAEQ